MKDKQDTTTNNKGAVNHVVLSKKPRKSYESISKDEKEQLQNLFLMDGITPFQASKVVGVHRATAQRYFDMWAEELVHEPEHESWAYRQNRVRARALEGITKKIIYVNRQRYNLEQVLDRQMFIKDDDGEFLKSADNMQDNLVLAYNHSIMELTAQLMTLQDEYDAIDSQPPAAVILKQEILDLANEIQRVDT